MGTSTRSISSQLMTDGTLERPHVRGKFLFVGEEKFWVRGVTYGTFRPDESGANYPSPDVVERDFTAIRNAGLNSVRVYTVPPRWLLDLAAARGLRLMIGLPWEQHVAFLDDKARVARHHRSSAGLCPTMRRSSGGTVLCRRKRDPSLCRSLVRQAPDPKFPR